MQIQDWRIRVRNGSVKPPWAQAMDGALCSYCNAAPMEGAFSTPGTGEPRSLPTASRPQGWQPGAGKSPASRQTSIRPPQQHPLHLWSTGRSSGLICGGRTCMETHPNSSWFGKAKRGQFIGTLEGFFFKLPIKTSEDGELPKRDNNPWAHTFQKLLNPLIFSNWC